MKQALGWLWMAGAIAALIIVQTFRHSEPLASMDALLNAGRVLVPLGIAVTIVGAGLLLGALIQGLVFDAQRARPGDVSGPYSGPGPSGGWRIGYFKGTLLWGASFHEESGISELKRAWRTGEWLSDHRLFRTTLVIVGLPVVLIGAFGTIALITDVTAVRLILILAVAYASVRLGFTLLRA